MTGKITILVGTMSGTAEMVADALLEAIERDQLKILTATIQARTKLQVPYYSDGHRRKAHAS